MTETWQREDEEVLVEDTKIEQLLRARIASGQAMTTFTSSLGRILMFVTNGSRAMVVLLDGEGDAGQHAVDPSAEGISGGYVMDNGQVDEYPNSDTVDLELALRAIRDVVAGSSTTAVTWRTDR